MNFIKKLQIEKFLALLLVAPVFTNAMEYLPPKKDVTEQKIKDVYQLLPEELAQSVASTVLPQLSKKDQHLLALKSVQEAVKHGSTIPEKSYEYLAHCLKNIIDKNPRIMLDQGIEALLNAVIPQSAMYTTDSAEVISKYAPDKKQNEGLLQLLTPKTTNKKSKFLLDNPAFRSNLCKAFVKICKQYPYGNLPFHESTNNEQYEQRNVILPQLDKDWDYKYLFYSSVDFVNKIALPKDSDSIAFFDEQTLVAVTRAGKIFLIDLATNKITEKYNCVESIKSTKTYSFSPEMIREVVNTEKEKINWTDVNCTVSQKKTALEKPDLIVLDATGTYCAFGYKDSIQVYNIRTGECTIFDNDKPIAALHFSDQLNYLFGISNKKICMWDIKQKKLITEIDVSPFASTECMHDNQTQTLNLNAITSLYYSEKINHLFVGTFKSIPNYPGAQWCTILIFKLKDNNLQFIKEVETDAWLISSFSCTKNNDTLLLEGKHIRQGFDISSMNVVQWPSYFQGGIVKYLCHPNGETILRFYMSFNGIHSGMDLFDSHSSAFKNIQQRFTINLKQREYVSSYICLSKSGDQVAALSKDKKQCYLWKLPQFLTNSTNDLEHELFTYALWKYYEEAVKAKKAIRYNEIEQKYPSYSLSPDDQSVLSNHPLQLSYNLADHTMIKELINKSGFNSKKDEIRKAKLRLNQIVIEFLTTNNHQVRQKIFRFLNDYPVIPAGIILMQMYLFRNMLKRIHANTHL